MQQTYKNINGWFKFEKKFDIILKGFDSGVFVEIGAWFGKGTAYMVQKIKEEKKQIKFYVIDTWKGTEGLPVGEIAKKLGGNVYRVFEENMRACDMLDDIDVISESSIIAYKRFEDESIDLVYVDGDHRYEGTKADLDNFFPKLRKGGVMIIDYYTFEPVKQAVDEFCSEHNDITYEIDGNDWVMYKH